MQVKRYIIIGIALLLSTLTARAQQYFNLTADEVRIDSLLPVFTHKMPLGYSYADATYNVSIAYPEFIPMSEADIRRYQQITDAPLPSLPEISQVVSVDRKQGELIVSFVPLVFRDGKYQKLVSTTQTPVRRSSRAGGTVYADHSHRGQCRGESNDIAAILLCGGDIAGKFAHELLVLLPGTAASHLPVLHNMSTDYDIFFIPPLRNPHLAKSTVRAAETLFQLWLLLPDRERRRTVDD